MKHQIINLLSGPRNVSTALMYSFAQRSDTVIVDEPLYGHYLNVTNVYHPGQEKFINQLELNAKTAIESNILLYKGSSITFIKNMAHHIVKMDDSFLDTIDNVFLIRDPRQMIPSLINQIPNPTTRDVALAHQVKLYNRLSKNGSTPVIIDSKELLLNPKSILMQLCECLHIPFENDMLQWTKGSRTEDGPWAPFWYHNVHQSTGFSPYTEKNIEVPKKLKNLLNESLEYYHFLYELAIKNLSK